MSNRAEEEQLRLRKSGIVSLTARSGMQNRFSPRGEGGRETDHHLTCTLPIHDDVER